MYCRVGKFQGAQFSQIGCLYHLAGLIFADTYTSAHYGAYFIGLFFIVSRLSVKTTKIGPFKNLPLYSNAIIEYY